MNIYEREVNGCTQKWHDNFWWEQYDIDERVCLELCVEWADRPMSDRERWPFEMQSNCIVSPTYSIAYISERDRIEMQRNCCDTSRYLELQNQICCCETWKESLWKCQQNS